jgi:hypothetical protein
MRAVRSALREALRLDVHGHSLDAEAPRRGALGGSGMGRLGGDEARRDHDGD